MLGFRITVPVWREGGREGGRVEEREVGEMGGWRKGWEVGKRRVEGMGGGREGRKEREKEG